jgi:hypothetical protein
VSEDRSTTTSRTPPVVAGAPDDVRHASWPVERFYWAVLEAPGYARAGTLPPGLRPLLEDEVPVAADTLHAVATPLDAGRLLACAASREDLAALGPSTLSLTPSGMPEFADGAQAHSLNLLIGEFEPVVLRGARTRRHMLAMAACLAAAALASVGLIRRAAHWDRVRADVRSAGADVLKTIDLPSADALGLELARLRGSVPPETLSPRDAKPRTPDAAETLASLLSAWPSQIPSRPQSLIINSAGVAVAVNLEGGAAPFLREFKAPEGWAAEEPHLNTAGATTRVNLQLRPKQGTTP